MHFKLQYFIIFSLIFYRVNDSLTKFLVTDFGVFEILFFRSIFTIALLPVFLIYCKINYKCFFEKNIFIRNILAAVALFFEVASLEYLSLSTFILITYTSPICTKIFARIFLKEEMSGLDFFVIAVSIIGTLFIVDVSFENEQMVGIIYALLGAVLYSLSMIVTKKVKTRDANSIYFSYVFVLFLLSTLKFPGSIPQMSDTLILFAMAIIHVAAFLLSLKGLLGMKASRAAVLEYLGLVFAMILDYFFWNTVLSLEQIIGGFLIVASSLLSVYRESAVILFKKISVLLWKCTPCSTSNSNEE